MDYGSIDTFTSMEQPLLNCPKYARIILNIKDYISKFTTKFC